MCPRTVHPTCLPAHYGGTTGRTTHVRQSEHKRAILGRNNANVLAKHHAVAHPNQAPNFRTKIVKGGFRWNLERNIFEALEIHKQSNDPNINLLNQKSEWGHQGLVRLRVDN